MNDPLVLPIASSGTPATSANWAQRLLDGIDHFRSRCIAAFKAGFYLLLICAGMALAWRFLDLYEMAVRAETVQAQIAVERHRYVMDQLKAGKTAMTPEEVRQAIATGTAATPATAMVPAAHP
jgi:hypothetical protein